MVKCALARHAHATSPQRRRGRAPKLSQDCQRVVQKQLLQQSFGPNAAKSGRYWPSVVQEGKLSSAGRFLANIARCWPHAGQCWPHAGPIRIGECWSVLVEVGRMLESNNGAHIGQTIAESVLSSVLGETIGQLSDNVPRRMASMCSATFG